MIGVVTNTGKQGDVMDEIKPGDLVQLKSGGPVMTVSCNTDDFQKEKSVCCSWYCVDSRRFQDEDFSIISLKKVEVNND